MNLPPLVHGLNCRIAILLSPACREGALAQARDLANVLGALRAPDGRAIEAVIGAGMIGGAAAAGDAEPNIRPLEWLARSPWFVENVLFHPDAGRDFLSAMYVPADGLLNFMDCEAWIIVGANEGYVPKLRPTAIYCPDLARRYSSDPRDVLTPDDKRKMDETYLSWRHARCVFTTSPSALADIVSFSGVAPARALLTPPLGGEDDAPVAGASADDRPRQAYQSLVEAILRT